jgi:hypothetical protein
MRWPTLFELVICLAAVALLAAYLTPAIARSASAPRPLSETITATVSMVAGGLAAAGALWLIIREFGQWQTPQPDGEHSAD